MCSKFVLSGPRAFTDSDKRPFTQIIFSSLKENGNRTAFIDVVTGENVTYEDVLNKSLALVIAFKKLGIKKGDVICFLAENHVNYFIPFISALFSGVTSHLINPKFSNYELNHTICISKPKLVISTNYTLQKAITLRSNYDFVEMIINLDKSDGEDVLEMSDLIHLYKNEATSLKLERFDDFSLDAIIINSSGTTGLPKGVLLTHLNLKSILNYSNHDDYLNIIGEDVLLLYLPNFHIFGVFLFVSIVTTGSKGIVFPKFVLTKLLESVEKYQVKKLFIVPPIAVLLTKRQVMKEYDLSSLKDIICGGAPLGKEIENIIKERFGLKIRQLYGLSEVSGPVTICSKSSPLSSNVGKLVPGVFAKVLDIKTNIPLPSFKAGELCFKGVMVMKGYLTNPEATENIIDEDGYVHSGDWGYYDGDGNFYISDRLKDIIKYKAFQVAPAEIEDLLKSHSNIKDVAIIGIPDDLAGEVAKAFVVREPNSDVSDEEIINFVAKNLSFPKWLHGGVSFVDSIPKNASGKILRRKLRIQTGKLMEDEY